MRREEIQIDCVKVFASLVFSVGVLTNFQMDKNDGKKKITKKHIFIMKKNEKYNL
jgi:hypothetical protein